MSIPFSDPLVLAAFDAGWPVDEAVVSVTIASRRPLTVLEWLVLSVADAFGVAPDDLEIAKVTGLGHPLLIARGRESLMRLGALVGSGPLLLTGAGPIVGSLTEVGKSFLRDRSVPEKSAPRTVTIFIDALTDATRNRAQTKAGNEALEPIVPVAEGPRHVGRDRVAKHPSLPKNADVSIVDVNTVETKRQVERTPIQICLSPSGVIFHTTEDENRAKWLEAMELSLESLAREGDGQPFNSWARDVASSLRVTDETRALRQAIKEASGTIFATVGLVEAHGLAADLEAHARKGGLAVTIGGAERATWSQTSKGRLGLSAAVARSPVVSQPEFLVTERSAFRLAPVRVRGALGTPCTLRPLTMLTSAAAEQARASLSQLAGQAAMAWGSIDGDAIGLALRAPGAWTALSSRLLENVTMGGAEEAFKLGRWAEEQGVAAVEAREPSRQLIEVLLGTCAVDDVDRVWRLADQVAISCGDRIVAIVGARPHGRLIDDAESREVLEKLGSVTARYASLTPDVIERLRPMLDVRAVSDQDGVEAAARVLLRSRDVVGDTALTRWTDDVQSALARASKSTRFEAFQTLCGALRSDAELSKRALKSGRKPGGRR